MRAQGAELAFSYIERMADRVVPLAKQLDSDITFPMDVAGDEDIARGFRTLKAHWTEFDILVHAVAFATREALTGRFIEATTRGLSDRPRHLRATASPRSRANPCRS
jgi:enoyl-[acyl-carrier protein] reductase I